MIPNKVMTTAKTPYKKSKQRERILELLQSTGTHPTADWLYERLKEEFPSLSLGTVYRNVRILIDQGFLQKLDFGSTFDRFDARTEPHYHFICDRCGAVFDVEMRVDEELNKRAVREGKFQVRGHRIEFFGVCERCGKKG
jgi:Fur family peroxide stress response transcriptional regulator